MFGAADGGVPARGAVRTEFQPLLTRGEPVELAGVAAAGEARAGARKSASFPSVLAVAEEDCERRFSGTRVSMRRISCTLR